MSCFIAGTDTGVGKTRVASMLVRAWRSAGFDAVGFKPICCGDREDAEALTAASGGAVSLNDVNPVWLQPPVAPYVAAMIEGRTIDFPLIHETYARLRAGHAAVVIEGAGGWLVPVAHRHTMADLAVEFGQPVVVVTANRLGALNHTLLTVRAVQASGLRCAGVILNQLAAVRIEDSALVTNRAILEELLAAENIPLLGEVEFAAEILPDGLAERVRAETREAPARAVP